MLIISDERQSIVGEGVAGMADELLHGEDDRTWAVLDILARLGKSVGSRTICEELSASGRPTSEATVGRILRRLEFDGALKKCGQKGRVLTSQGNLLLETLTRARRQRSQGMALSTLLSDSGYRRIEEVTEMRLIVEGEAAALAARHGTAEQLQALGEILVRSRARVMSGHYSTEEDNLFHNTIAEATGNSVLASVVRFLRESEGIVALLMQVRYTLGLKPLQDHETIYAAICSRSPDSARAAMRSHVQNMLNDVRRYVIVQRQSAEEGTPAARA